MTRFFTSRAARITTSAALAGVLTAASMFGVTQSSNAAATSSACSASALTVSSGKALSVDVANPATTPCRTDAPGPIATASATLVAGLLGVGLKVTGLNADTVHGRSSDAAAVTVATVTISGLGILLKVTGISSGASQVCGDGVFRNSASTVANVSFNGRKIIVGSVPFNLNLGAGLQVNFNQTTHDANGNLVQRALAITSTHPNNINDYTAVGQAVVGGNC